MGMYEKPVISVDTGMAEGVYAASGSSNSKLSISDGITVNKWGSAGQKEFSIDTTGVEDGKTMITLYFNNTISNCWGGNTGITYSDKTAQLKWNWGGITKGTLTVTAQVDSSNIDDLKITGYKVE